MATLETYLRVSAVLLASVLGVNYITEHHAKILRNNVLVLSLDQSSGFGFRSKAEYLFGTIDMQLKLVSGNSAGTITAYHLPSEGPNHDEIDFEFLGNLNGEPYIVHTNVTQGIGNREQQFYLWFDPTKNFHTCTIVWNPQRIIQSMRLYSSLWCGDQWATRGGLVKTNWSFAPFKAYFSNFDAKACVWTKGSSSCPSNSATMITDIAWQAQNLDANNRRSLRWVQKYYRIYDYCKDYKRFSQGRPRECRLSGFS